MRALLDVNVLVALFDADHSLHAVALRWFDEHGGAGWATCPIARDRVVSKMCPLWAVGRNSLTIAKSSALSKTSNQAVLLLSQYITA